MPDVIRTSQSLIVFKKTIHITKIRCIYYPTALCRIHVQYKMAPVTSYAPKQVQISCNICTPEDRLDRCSHNMHVTHWIEVTKKQFGLLDNKSLVEPLFTQLYKWVLAIVGGSSSFYAIETGPMGHLACTKQNTFH